MCEQHGTGERKKRAREELALAAGHLWYEAKMLIAAGESFLETSDKLALESFLLHARNLIDFAFPRKRPWDDEVLAQDYFESPDKWNPPTNSLLEETRSRAHTKLSHLSYDRNSEEHKWPVGKIGNAILELIGRFEERVKDRTLLPARSLPRALNVPSEKMEVFGSTEGVMAFSSMTFGKDGKFIIWAEE